MEPKLLKHQEIQSWLLQEISGGKFAIGDKFYSQNNLSEKFGVTPVTARQGLDALEKNGYISRKRGSGTFVTKIPENPSRYKILKRCVIGIVLAGVDFNSNVTVGGILMELYKYIENAGYLAVLTNEDITPLKDMDVIGIITINKQPAEMAKKFISLGVPIVSYSPYETAFAHNQTDWHNAAAKVLDAFIKSKDCKHVAIVGEGSDAILVRDRFSSFLQEECQKNDIKFSDCVSDCDLEETQLKKLLKSNQRPDSIFLMNSWSAQKLFDVCAKLKLNIPSDIAIIIHGYNAISMPALPLLSLLCLDISECARNAVNMLMELISGASRKSIKTCTQYKLIDCGNFTGKNS